AAVHDGLRAELDRQLSHGLRDHRARERRHERILALVERVRLDRARALLVGERGLTVDQDDVVGAGGAAALDRRLEVELLADVDEDGDDLVEAVAVLLQPADDATRVEAAGEGDHRDPAHLAPWVECILFTIAGFHATVRLGPCSPDSSTAARGRRISPATSPAPRKGIRSATSPATSVAAAIRSRAPMRSPPGRPRRGSGRTRSSSATTTAPAGRPGSGGSCATSATTRRR